MNPINEQLIHAPDTHGKALAKSSEKLSQAGIEDSSLEAAILMAHSLKMDRVQLYLKIHEMLTAEKADLFNGMLERRLKGEPAAYITGHREFYGLDFTVNKNVLIPRPETEILVEKSLELIGSKSATIADIGTGSGCIAISLAKTFAARRMGEAKRNPLAAPDSSNGANIKIYATDISKAALGVAAMNCEKHAVADIITLLHGDLLEPLPAPVDLIIANLPYVNLADMPKVNTRGFEPELALNGGSDGLDQIRRLCAQLNEKLKTGGSLLLEIGYDQQKAVTSLLLSLFPSATIEQFTDGAGLVRVVSLKI